MAFDFPASPTENQTFQPPGGPLYIYKAPAWQVMSDIGTPAGMIGYFARNTAPPGWLKANGALLSRVLYPALFTAIGTTFGVGDGSTTFGTPDLRAEFIRSWDDGRAIDSGRVFGSAQAEAIGSHVHVITHTTTTESADHTHAIGGTTSGISANHTHSFSDSSSATGNASANHSHTIGGSGFAVFGTGNTGNVAGGNLFSDTTTAATGSAHTHTVAVSGTTGGNSVGHTHTFADTSGGRSAAHTHSFTGSSAANTGFGPETRPRNVALLACIKY